MTTEPAEALRDALDVLSRAEVEKAWAAAEVTIKSLGSTSIALRAEIAAYLLAMILAEIGNATTRPDDLSDVAAAVESLSLYVTGRMAVIVVDVSSSSGNA